MKLFEKDLESVLLNNFSGLMTHALDHLLSSNPSTIDLTQGILNLQAAMEIVAKHHMLETQGWKALIVTKKGQISAEAEMIDKLHRGDIQTIKFWQVSEHVRSRIIMGEIEEELLAFFQNTRNSIVHLGVYDIHQDVVYKSILFVLRFVNILAMSESSVVRDSWGRNQARHYLGDALYARVLGNQDYRSEAVDFAAERCDGDIFYCPDCGTQAVGALENGVILCFACGFRMGEEALAFGRCPECAKDGALAYDCLPGAGVPTAGKCAVCGFHGIVVCCPECEGISLEGYPKCSCVIV